MYDSYLKKLLKYVAMFFVAYLASQYAVKDMLDSTSSVQVAMICTTFYAFLESYFPAVYIDKFEWVRLSNKI
jgi:hypothetical protein